MITKRVLLPLSMQICHIIYSAITKFCYVRMDATDAKDCIGRYLQHSSKDFNCKPICRIVGEKPRVFFVAGEDIDSGSELRYNHCNRMLETATP